MKVAEEELSSFKSSCGNVRAREGRRPRRRLLTARAARVAVPQGRRVQVRLVPVPGQAGVRRRRRARDAERGRRHLRPALPCSCCGVGCVRSRSRLVALGVVHQHVVAAGEHLVDYSVQIQHFARVVRALEHRGRRPCGRRHQRCVRRRPRGRDAAPDLPRSCQPSYRSSSYLAMATLASHFTFCGASPALPQTTEMIFSFTCAYTTKCSVSVAISAVTLRLCVAPRCRKRPAGNGPNSSARVSPHGGLPAAGGAGRAGQQRP